MRAKGLPQITPFDFGDEPLNNGELTGVQCIVPKGDLPVEIYWTLNANPIITGQDSFTIMRLNARTSALSIESLNAGHRGIYKCVTKNKAGIAELSAELKVNGMRSFNRCAFVVFCIISVIILVLYTICLPLKSQFK